ncbi:MAG: glycosyltransferase family 2 protein [Candidatus Methanoperedens sp.]|nr:glycosyltransferase family 2 protein [Candidatus Methanoperedens sp.]
MTITAILPAYNKEVHIGTLVLQTKKHVDNVLVIDDGSSDRTGEMAKLAGAKVIRHTRKMGKGAALKSGFEYVGRNGAKVIVTMDFDSEYNPDYIPTLINPILKGEADVVNGSWQVKHSGKKLHFSQFKGKYSIDNVLNSNPRLSTTDMQSGIQAFARHTLTAFKFKSNGNTNGNDMLNDAANAGLRVKEIEIGVKQSVDCTTQNDRKHVLKTLVRMLEDIELCRPLYYLTIPGMVCTIIGMGLGLDILKDFFIGETLRFWPMLFMIVLTLLGIFMAFTGIILHSVSRLINENNKTKHANSRGIP